MLETRSLDLARRSLFGTSNGSAAVLARATLFRAFLFDSWERADAIAWSRASKALEAAVVARGFGRRRVTTSTLLKDARAYLSFLEESTV